MEATDPACSYLLESYFSGFSESLIGAASRGIDAPGSPHIFWEEFRADSQRQRGASHRLLLVGLIGVALASAPAFAALHSMHRPLSTKALIYTSPPQPTRSQPRVVVATLPSTHVALSLSPSSRPGPQLTAHKFKSARSHHAHPRASIKEDPDSLQASACRDQISQTRANLAEGLGLGSMGPCAPQPERPPTQP